MIVLGKSISSKDEESKDHFKVGVRFGSRAPRDTPVTLNAQKLVRLCVSQFSLVVKMFAVHASVTKEF